MKDNLKNLIVALLDDDYGITEEAYYELKDMINFMFGEEALNEFTECVDATDGRFYFGDTIPSFLQ